MLAVEGDRAQHTGSCYKEWHQTWWRDNTKISVLWFSSLNCAVCFPGASQYWKGNTEIGRKAFLEFNSLKSRGCISRLIHMCYATNSFCDMWCFLNNLPVSLERSSSLVTTKCAERLLNNCVIITATSDGLTRHSNILLFWHDTENTKTCIYHFTDIESYYRTLAR